MNTEMLFRFVVGLILLVLGANWLVKGASRLASLAGISPLVIGLTIVAFGTSAPEMIVSVQSALSGQVDVAIGNVVGSNIFNVLFILGLSSMLAPLIVARQLVWFDVPVMIGLSVGVMLLGLDGSIGRGEGAVLFAGCIAYTLYQIRLSRRETAKDDQQSPVEMAVETRRGGAGILQDLAWIAAGLVGLGFGAKWLVAAAVVFAQSLGVSELVIGLTIVAAGTSLPEVATSVIASLRGERDIAVGNAIGSNIFNILGVLGMSAMLAPNGLPVASQALNFDIPIMIVVAGACFPIFWTSYEIRRWEGWMLFGYYVLYTAALVLLAQQHPVMPALQKAVLWGILPGTAVVLVYTMAQQRLLEQLPERFGKPQA